jgi:hypothetical protein
MKKLSLILLICLCACGQSSPSRISLFNEANSTVGNRPPSGYIEDGDSYWKSRDLAVGKDWIVLQTSGNIVEQAIVGCLFANTGAQTKWLKESYDTLVADKWALLSDEGGVWVLMKGDNLASGVSSVDNGNISASVVFMSVSTALGDSTGGTTDSGTVSNTGGNMVSATWTAVDVSGIFGTDSINAIAYGGGKFVAGGDGGKIAISTDGTNWTAIFSPFDDSVNAIVYDGGKFVAGAEGMAASADGETWRGISVFEIFGWGTINTVGYGNGRYVVGGYDGAFADKIGASTDGTAWTAVTTKAFDYVDPEFGHTTTAGITAIAYGGNRFVAGGEMGKMAYSSNGTAWTAADDGGIFRDGFIRSIAYGSGKFVAVGDAGKMAYSSDGTTWTAVSDTKFGTSYIYAVAYGNGRFVAGGADGKTAVSTDGTTWTAIDTGTLFDFNFYGSIDKGEIHAIAYGNGRFVAVGFAGKMAYLAD